MKALFLASALSAISLAGLAQEKKAAAPSNGIYAKIALSPVSQDIFVVKGLGDYAEDSIVMDFRKNADTAGAHRADVYIMTPNVNKAKNGLPSDTVRFEVSMPSKNFFTLLGDDGSLIVTDLSTSKATAAYMNLVPGTHGFNVRKESAYIRSNRF